MMNLLKFTECEYSLRSEDIHEYPTRCDMVDFRRLGHN